MLREVDVYHTDTKDIAEGGVRLTSIIVVFYKLEEAKNIRNVLVKYGFQVKTVCSTGAQVMAALEEMNDGIVVSGSKYLDMTAGELRYIMPQNFEMLLVASMQNLEDNMGNGVVGLPMPLKVHDLVETLGMMAQNMDRRRKKRRSVPKERNEEEIKIIEQAKKLLMERNGMSEEEAHRYIQKNSMDSGTGKVETAQMILALMEG